MKPEDNDKQLDDRLTRALGRQSPIPDFSQWKKSHPDAVETLRSLARAPQGADAARAATRNKGRLQAFAERIFTMNRIAKTAAAVVIAAGAIGLIAYFTIGDGGASIAWADVQEKIRNARTMTYKTKVKVEGLPTMETTVMLKEPGLMRQEMTMGPSKVITIMDIRQGKMIALVEAQKKSTTYDLTGLPAEERKKQEEQDFLAGIKKLIEESETELGEKKIDGRAVKGYRVEKGKQVITIWADAKTAQPVEMNMTMFQGETKGTMSEFKFDVELDDALFSVEVPKGEGYTVDKKQMEFKEPSVADLVETLRVWTRIRGGTFPDALTPSHLRKDTMSFVKACKDGKLENKAFAQDLAKDGGQKTTLSISRAMMLLSLHGEACYAGEGVEVGDGDTAIFWYQPKDSETYTVIYGDLRIEEGVAEEDLPEAPKDADSAPDGDNTE